MVGSNRHVGSTPTPSAIICYNLNMQSRSLIYLGLFIGSAIGGYVPALWDAELFSFSGIISSAIGGVAGIYLGFKIS